MLDTDMLLDGFDVPSPEARIIVEAFPIACGTTRVATFEGWERTPRFRETLADPTTAYLECIAYWDPFSDDNAFDVQGERKYLRRSLHIIPRHLGLNLKRRQYRSIAAGEFKHAMGLWRSFLVARRTDRRAARRILKSIRQSLAYVRQCLWDSRDLE